jgi:hypothetical protein
LGKTLVAQTVELTLASYVRELSLEIRKIEWPPQVFGELLLNSLIGIVIGARDDDLLDLCYRRVLPCIPFIEISLPLGWIGDGVRQKVASGSRDSSLQTKDEFIELRQSLMANLSRVDTDAGFGTKRVLVLVIMTINPLLLADGV